MRAIIAGGTGFIGRELVRELREHGWDILILSRNPGKVAAGLAALVERHRPDEVILTGQIHDQAARLHSFEIAAEAMRKIGAPSPTAAG